jgi:hypothetical protein
LPVSSPPKVSPNDKSPMRSVVRKLTNFTTSTTPLDLLASFRRHKTNWSVYRCKYDSCKESAFSEKACACRRRSLR